MDCIDLYYLHRHDKKTPIEVTMGAFKVGLVVSWIRDEACRQELIDQGKIKYVGMSEVSISTLRKAHAVCPVTAYEMEWSLITRDVEEDLVPTCRELGIGKRVSWSSAKVFCAIFCRYRHLQSAGPRISDWCDQEQGRHSERRLARKAPTSE